MTKLQNCIHMCASIGEIPTSYLDSMTYEEQLLWLCEFLNKKVLPSLNEMKNFFDNLDVQDEINKKLEEMAESGELEEIIAAYLNVNTILAYNTVAEMKIADNLVEGSFTKTLGKNTYNDGLGSFYKIRTITSSDVVDEINIISLQKSNTLIAELIKNKPLNDVIGNVLTELVILGDSFTYPNNSWCHEVANQLHLNLHNMAYNSMGYTNAVSGKVFKDVLSDITDVNIRNKTKYVICFGGINDGALLTTPTVDETAVYNAVKEFCSTAKNLYPNATILIAGTNYKRVGYDNITKIQLINAISKGATESGCAYVDPSGWLLNNNINPDNLYQSDGVHPNDLGQMIIASKMLSTIIGLPLNENTPILTLDSSSVNFGNAQMVKTSTGVRYYVAVQGDFANGSFKNIGSFSKLNSGYEISGMCPIALIDQTYGLGESLFGFAYIRTVGNVPTLTVVNKTGNNLTNRQIRFVIDIDNNRIRTSFFNNL